MYNSKTNNYHLNPKNSNIYTPPEVSEFIFELLRNKIKKWSRIFDPCCGKGSLLEPWKEDAFVTYGIDIENHSGVDAVQNFLKWDGSGILKFDNKPALILCNPPFNGYGNKLASEVWLDKIIELFGKDIPIVFFTPMGFRLNSKKNGKRWTKFNSNKYPPISSIISLPRDIFPNVEFHSEILIFNVQGLKGHYFFKNYE